MGPAEEDEAETGSTRKNFQFSLVYQLVVLRGVRVHNHLVRLGHLQQVGLGSGLGSGRDWWVPSASGQCALVATNPHHIIKLRVPGQAAMLRGGVRTGGAQQDWSGRQRNCGCERQRRTAGHSQGGPLRWQGATWVASHGG